MDAGYTVEAAAWHHWEAAQTSHCNVALTSSIDDARAKCLSLVTDRSQWMHYSSASCDKKGAINIKTHYNLSCLEHPVDVQQCVYDSLRPSLAAGNDGSSLRVQPQPYAAASAQCHAVFGAGGPWGKCSGGFSSCKACQCAQGLWCYDQSHQALACISGI